MAARTANNEGTKNALATQEATAGSSGTMTIAKYLEAQKPAIMAALPRNIDVDRFTRIVLTAVRTNPDLLGCDPMSILAATMQSAQLGLEPGSGLGEAYIIPYKREATFQMGYKGLVKLARNSGDVTSIWSEAVYEGDLFRVVMGSDPKIEHIPDLNVARGSFENVEAVYAVARLATGDIQFAVMTKAEIEQHRNRYSRGASSSKSPWSDPLGAVEMAKKTVVLRLCKMLPLSAEVSRAIASDGTIRRELSADMSALPDIEDEKVPAAALGAVESEVVTVDVEEVPLEGEVVTDVSAMMEELPWNKE
jgi:recombination protein RecT